LVFSIFGALAVFSDTFRNTWWRKEDESELDKKLFPGKSGYYFNRYGRGLGSLTLGIMMIFSFVGTLWKPILPILAVVASPGEWLDSGYGRVLFTILAVAAIYVLAKTVLQHAELNDHHKDRQ